MNIFKRFWHVLSGASMAEEAIQRFMVPQANRLREMGVSESDISTLGHIAIQQSNGVSRFPGGVLRDMADLIENGDVTAAELIELYKFGVIE